MRRGRTHRRRDAHHVRWRCALFVVGGSNGADAWVVTPGHVVGNELRCVPVSLAGTFDEVPGLAVLDLETGALGEAVTDVGIAPIG